MENKLFSVVVLCYRHFEHLNTAIRSVLEQDYGQIELIVSDDGSDGFPAKKIRAFIEKNRGENIASVTVRQEEHNVGTVKHLNHARRCCHGEYIVFLAGDDALYNEHTLSAYAEGFAEAPENCYIEMAQTAMYDEKLETLTEYYLKKPVQDAIAATKDGSDDLLKLLVRYGVCLPSTSTCFAAAFFERFGDFDESYKLVEDVPMHFRLAGEHWVIHYANFVAIKHRHGGISHGQSGALSKSVVMYYTDLHRTMTELVLPKIDMLEPEERSMVRRYWKKQTVWIELNVLGQQHGVWNSLVNMARKAKHGTLRLPVKKWDWFLKGYLFTMASKSYIAAMLAEEFGLSVLPALNAFAWLLLGGLCVTAGIRFGITVLRKLIRFPKESIAIG